MNNKTFVNEFKKYNVYGGEIPTCVVSCKIKGRYLEITTSVPSHNSMMLGYCSGAVYFVGDNGELASSPIDGDLADNIRAIYKGDVSITINGRSSVYMIEDDSNDIFYIYDKSSKEVSKKRLWEKVYELDEKNDRLSKWSCELHTYQRNIRKTIEDAVYNFDRENVDIEKLLSDILDISQNDLGRRLVGFEGLAYSPIKKEIKYFGIAEKMTQAVQEMWPTENSEPKIDTTIEDPNKY